MVSARVGVDGGQSLIRLRVVGDDEVRTAPGASHLETDPGEAVVTAVASLVPAGHIELVVAGLTTLPAAGADRTALAARIGEATDAARVWVCGDQVTTHAGAFAGRSGVALAVGTGVACFALDTASGSHRTFDGAGYLLGDEGGAFWIGSHGIRAVIAADEGRGPETSMTCTAVKRLGPLSGLAARIHGGPRPVDTIAHFAPAVIEHAEAGDPVAATIVTDAARRLASTIAAAARLVDGPAEVAMTGRLIQHGSLLAKAVAGELGSTEVTVVAAEGTALDGACLLAERAEAGAYADLITEWRRAS